MSEWAYDKMDEMREEIAKLAKERDALLEEARTLISERNDLLKASSEFVGICYYADDGDGWEVRISDPKGVGWILFQRLAKVTDTKPQEKGGVDGNHSA